MARTTASAVAGITVVDAGDDVTPFIETANAMVTQHCTSSGYTAATLELIERWLAGHFYRVYNAGLTGEGAGSVRATYRSRVDLALNVTHEGQQAMLLDYAGNLAQLNKAIVDGEASVFALQWLGAEDGELPAT